MRARTVVLAFSAVAIAFFGARVTVRLSTASAASASGKPAAAAKDVSTSDNFQRSVHLDNYTLLATSGAARGENIYFFKCWMCHNKYAKGGPYLKDLFKEENLMNG